MTGVAIGYGYLKKALDDLKREPAKEEKALPAVQSGTYDVSRIAHDQVSSIKLPTVVDLHKLVPTLPENPVCALTGKDEGLLAVWTKNDGVQIYSLHHIALKLKSLEDTLLETKKNAENEIALLKKQLSLLTVIKKTAAPPVPKLESVEKQ